MCSRRMLLDCVQLVAAFGAVFCIAFYAVAKTCEECKDVTDCDCNCKELTCLKSYDKGNFLGCSHWSIKTCFSQEQPKVYVVGGKDVACDPSALYAVKRNGINCTKECSGCGQTGSFESQIDPDYPDTCSPGATVLNEYFPVRRCGKS